MKRLLLTTILLAALLRGQEAAHAGPACSESTCAGSGPLFSAYFKLMEIGSISGVSYEDGRYLLYATKPAKGYKPVILYRDTVAQLGRLLLLAGDDPAGGFSMDFVPSGSKKFGPDDVLDAQRFGSILASTARFAVALRFSPGGAQVLRECLTLKKDEKPSKALRQRIADLLNQARSRSDIVSLIVPEELQPETRVFLKTGHDRLHLNQINRILIESFFQPSIDQDVEDKYQVVFKASEPEVEERIRPLLLHTRAAAIWLAGDTRLKMMVAGKQGLHYKIGPSQQILCAEEARSQLARGVDLNTGQFVDYLRLRVDYEDINGVGEWFRNPRLEARAGVVAGKQTPACALEWSVRLSKRLPWILGLDDPVADDLRALMQILLVHRAIAYLWQTAPMDLNRLELLQRDADDLANDPPQVLKTEIEIGARGEVHLLTIAGGIDWGGANPAPHPVKSETLQRIDNGALRDNGGFLVTHLPDGQMRIDITSILAP